MEKILYAVKIGEPDYMEQIITTNQDVIEQARAWAKANGFDRFRIATYNGEAPNFIGALNI